MRGKVVKGPYSHLLHDSGCTDGIITYVMSWGWFFELDAAELLCTSGHSLMSCLQTILRLPMLTMRTLQDTSS